MYPLGSEVTIGGRWEWRPPGENRSLVALEFILSLGTHLQQERSTLIGVSSIEWRATVTMHAIDVRSVLVQVTSHFQVTPGTCEAERRLQIIVERVDICTVLNQP